MVVNGHNHGINFTLRTLPNNFYTVKKGFVISTIIFFTRVATVDMVLWKDTRIVPHNNQLWAIQCTWSIRAQVVVLQFT